MCNKLQIKITKKKPTKDTPPLIKALYDLKKKNDGSVVFLIIKDLEKPVSQMNF